MHATSSRDCEDSQQYKDIKDLQHEYSVPYAILQLLEELFSRPWLSLESPRFHRSLDIVSRCPHKNFSALRPKSGHLRQSNHPPLFARRRSASYWAKKWKWVEKSCWARKGFSNAPTSGARRGGDGCSVSNAHFFGRRAEKFLWGTRDTKVSIWWRRGGSSENQGGENSSSKKATTSKGTL